MVNHHEKGSIIWVNIFGTYSIRIVHKQIQVMVSKDVYSNVTLKLWGKDEARFEDYIIYASYYIFQVGWFNHQLDQEVFGF